MKRYLSIYYQLLKAAFSSIAAYRMNFIMGIFTSLAWGALSLVVILLLTARVSTVAGWKPYELLILICLVNVVIGIYRMIFDISFWKLSSIVHYGELDMLLLKPLDSQFQASVWIFDYSAIPRVVIGIGIIFYLLSVNHIPLSIPTMLAFTFFIITGVILIYSFAFSLLSFTIKFSRLNNLYDFINQLLTVTRYPKELYTGLNQILLYVLLPLVLVITTPTQVILNKMSIPDMLLVLFFTICLFLMSRFVWKFALRFYTSAN